TTSSRTTKSNLMSARHLRGPTAALLVSCALCSPAAAHASTLWAAASVSAMSSGRLGASVAAVVGLIGVGVGGSALTRSTRRFGTGNSRNAALVALVAGLLAVALGGLIVATADGGIGTGNGLGGALVALVVGSISMVIGGLAIARARSAG
ncbi:DUF6223 family protein, partial [Nocardia abscessus]|uniref:DUF6223 family protein n=1 Tax=Nocardia abscessus TaxID=120957 RepID=UPI00245502F5